MATISSTYQSYEIPVTSALVATSDPKLLSLLSMALRQTGIEVQEFQTLSGIPENADTYRLFVVDGDSFRLYYSDSDFNGDDEHSAGNIGRLSGGTHSLIVRQGDFKVETLLSLEALVLLRFMTEFMARVGDSDFTDEEFEEEIEGKTTTELMKLMFRL